MCAGNASASIAGFNIQMQLNMSETVAVSLAYVTTAVDSVVVPGSAVPVSTPTSSTPGGLPADSTTGAGAVQQRDDKAPGGAQQQQLGEVPAQACNPALQAKILALIHAYMGHLTELRDMQVGGRGGRGEARTEQGSRGQSVQGGSLVSGRGLTQQRPRPGQGCFHQALAFRQGHTGQVQCSWKGPSKARPHTHLIHECTHLHLCLAPPGDCLPGGTGA